MQNPQSFPADSQAFLRRLKKRKSALMSERDRLWVPHWRQINKYISPRGARFFKEDANDGRRRDNAIINNGATLASRALRSGLASGLTSPSRPWFLLKLPDPAMNEVDAVKLWLHDVTGRMLEVLSKSNLYNALPVLYGHLADYGTGFMTIVEDAEHGVRFEVWPVGSYALTADAAGRVSGAVRDYRMTASQMVEAFGEHAVSQAVLSAHDNGEEATRFDVTHFICRNEEWIEDREDVAGKPWLSVYFQSGGADPDKPFLKIAGFLEFPGAGPRWEVNGEDVYGSSCPGMIALGDAKELQHHARVKAQALDLLVDPPKVAHPMLKNQLTDLLPGSVTYTEFAGREAGFRTAYEIRPQTGELGAEIMNVQRRIDEAYFKDLFLLLSMDTRSNITAREVQERHEEKLLMLGPVLERLNDELLAPLIDRVFAILYRKGVFPPPPAELSDADLRVEFVSILAQAQKAVGLTALDRMLALAGGIAQMNPESLDKLDFDQLMDEAGETLGVPPRILRGDEAVETMRAEREQQHQAAQALTTAQQGAGMAKTLKEAGVEGGDLLKLVGGTG